VSGPDIGATPSRHARDAIEVTARDNPDLAGMAPRNRSLLIRHDSTEARMRRTISTALMQRTVASGR